MYSTIKSVIVAGLFMPVFFACSSSKDINESDVASFGTCDPGYFKASHCTNLTQNRTKVIEVNYSKDDLVRAGSAVDDGNGFAALNPGDKPFIDFRYITGSQTAEIQIEAELLYNEVQFREQEWKRSGLAGLERKRVWKERDRSHAVASLYVDIDGAKYVSPQYDTRALEASDWSEDRSDLKTWIGPFNPLNAANYVNLITDILAVPIDGRKLSVAFRKFSGSSKVTIIARIPPNRNSVVKLGSIFQGTGGVRVSPVKMTIQTFDVADEDNNLLMWSFSGSIPGRYCTQFDEEADYAHTWGDNFLCAQRDIGLKFSNVGPIEGKKCISINEPSDVAGTWGDNYLCWSDPFINLSWFFYDPGKKEACVLVNEPAEPAETNWHDNYICWNR